MAAITTLPDENENSDLGFWFACSCGCGLFVLDIKALYSPETFNLSMESDVFLFSVSMKLLYSSSGGSMLHMLMQCQTRFTFQVKR